MHLGLSGPHIKGFNSRGVIAVAGKNREITREDVRRAIDAAKAVSLPTGREVLHVLPQDFVVDEQDGIGAPVSMTGARLEVNVHIVTGSQSSTQNIVACVNRAGVNVKEMVVEQLAASESNARRRTRKNLVWRWSTLAAAATDIAIWGARQSVAHGRDRRGWRSLHERYRRRTADAVPTRREDQAQVRLCLVGHGG